MSRRWAWLLSLGLVVGLFTGYLVSKLQMPIYEASTKLLVSNELYGKNSDFAGLTNQQLVLAYVELLKTERLKDSVSNKLELEISSNQVKIQRITDTQIIEIRAESHDSEQAAEIANMMGLALIEEIDSLRTEQFSALEESLINQIEQMEIQIDELQQEYDRIYKLSYEQAFQSQLFRVNEQISNIQEELSTLQKEIANLSNIWTSEDRAQLAEKETRVIQLQSSFRVYDEIRGNLLISGKPIQIGGLDDDARLQKMRSTNELYKNIYFDLLTELEEMRLTRMQKTPNIVQIELASAPHRPDRPLPLMNTILSGIVGLILTGTIMFIFDTNRKEINIESNGSNRRDE